MKYLFVVATLFVFAGCKKAKVASNNYMTCTMNGNKWTATEGSLQANAGNISIYIGGSSPSTDIIGIVVRDSSGIKSGDYMLTRLDTASGAEYNESIGLHAPPPYYTNSGAYVGAVHLIIDEKQSRVSGTFSFKAKSAGISGFEIEVTDGSFSMPYTVK